ncbi:Tho complex subunit 7-domain-containing protein [Crepidotus variabilis]|uniref:Tho complex subunit 7-domain-containing protein n=1 Tax=Crepidotus variabilis TaxID=179855 RepID=A0A9P6ET63_9AGAR|nr:Tho complex subunit 7-domain-containing protein [Crepidotus variabilis]
MTTEEEGQFVLSVADTPIYRNYVDQVIQTRITLDERPLRRIIKRFHNYTSVSRTPLVPSISNRIAGENAVSDTRDAFFLELASFDLLMQKNSMVCEAEKRQVEEYRCERERIDNEHETLQAQIEELKTALEHAHMLRRRKIEYDVIAERVNILPSREELETSIQSLENDMAAIRSEHDTQNRTIHSQKSALDGIISELSSLRFMGKEPDTASTTQSQRGTPALEGTPAPPDTETDPVDSSLTSITTEEGEEGEEKTINASPSKTGSEGADNDIEMGEVQEEPKEKTGRKREEELEEGEATDASSELSEPPED